MILLGYEKEKDVYRIYRKILKDFEDNSNNDNVKHDDGVRRYNELPKIHGKDVCMVRIFLFKEFGIFISIFLRYVEHFGIFVIEIIYCFNNKISNNWSHNLNVYMFKY